LVAPQGLKILPPHIIFPAIGFIKMNTKQNSPSYPTVDDYLDALTQEVKYAMQNLRQAIIAAAPQAQELISYRIPTYKYHGALVHFQAHPQHCSFITASKAVVDSFKLELKGYKVSGTTIHFTPEKPLPKELVMKIVRARMTENEFSVKNR